MKIITIRGKRYVWNYKRTILVAAVIAAIAVGAFAFAGQEPADQARVYEPEDSIVVKDLFPVPVVADVPLDAELQELLEKYGDEGKSPNPMAKSMSWMKTNMKLAMDDSDATVADLMTDGCNMGVKSLSRYLNQYAAADETSKDICKRLIKLEEDLSIQMRDYL